MVFFQVARGLFFFNHQSEAHGFPSCQFASFWQTVTFVCYLIYRRRQAPVMLRCKNPRYRTLEVRANAETLAEANLAKSFGAQGLGLVRTEHMSLGMEVCWLVLWSHILWEKVGDMCWVLRVCYVDHRVFFRSSLIGALWNGWQYHHYEMDKPRHSINPDVF